VEGREGHTQWGSTKRRRGVKARQIYKARQICKARQRYKADKLS
jgi:hypothetical protein